MKDRWDNIFGGFDWERIRSDFEDFHKRADDAGLRLKISDDACPCCGFRPTVLINHAREKKRDPKHDVVRQVQLPSVKQQPKQLPLFSDSQRKGRQ